MKSEDAVSRLCCDQHPDHVPNADHASPSSPGRSSAKDSISPPGLLPAVVNPVPEPVVYVAGVSGISPNRP